ncbi:MAG: OmpH family outer membrane protein [Planctomycetia bacterium]|nr:OmpH family outer membrane protein [Planctomycetia bacterium]
MRITLIWATAVAILLAASAFTNLQAQQTQAPPSRAATPPVANHGIAVIDVKYILEHYSRVKNATDQFSRDFDDVSARFRKEKEAINKKVEKIRTFNPGTPEYKKLEEEIAQNDSDLKVKASLQQKEFAEREAKIYLTAYQEISQQVKTYADRNGITLVLRFNGAPPDPNNREAVQAELFKMVLYQNGIDITGPVLQELNRSAAVARPPANPNRTDAPPRR